MLLLQKELLLKEALLRKSHVALDPDDEDVDDACAPAALSAQRHRTRHDAVCIIVQSSFDRCGCQERRPGRERQQRKRCEARTESSPMASSSADFCKALRLE